jgi:hypothetical protein
MSNSITIGPGTITFTDGSNTRTISLDATNNHVSFATAAVSGASFEAGAQVIAVGGISGGGLSGSASGGIASFTITVAGGGFSANDSESFFNKSSSGSGGAFTVTSTDASGGIAALTVTNAGSGYVVNDVLYCGDEQLGGIRPEIRVDSLA